MSSISLGSTLVIANPVSHSGKGAGGAEVVRRFFDVYTSATTSVELRMTEAPGDAERMAADAAEYDTVMVLGGDGVIHEAVNGLMAIDAEQRPRLAIIPFGSGNDFARTLSLTANDPDAALSELLNGVERTLDLGHVVSEKCPEGTYFTESLSFGLDAAIALDTTKRRAEGTKQEGSGLFLTSSIKLALNAGKAHPCLARINDEMPMQLNSLIFAVLNGPTYGGGFKICPDANPCDRLLDVCYSVGNPLMPHLLFLLGLARFGKHTHSRVARLRTLEKVRIDFIGDVPCQVDGEELLGRHFTIYIVPSALRVMVSRSFRW